MTTSARKAIHRGSRMPNARSREYFPGPASMRADAMDIFVTGSSGPPSVTQIGLPQWAFLVAMAIAPMTPMGPSGLSSPRSESTPPPNSEPPAMTAQGRPRRSPMDSSQALVPSRPYPPHQPNSFWAPWPVMSPPSTRRNTSVARFLTYISFLRPRLGSLPGSSRVISTLSTGCSTRGYRIQPGLYLLAPSLEEGGQREPLAEVGCVLVRGEAGAVCGDLEEHPARLAEVDRPEVVRSEERRVGKECRSRWS